MATNSFGITKLEDGTQLVTFDVNVYQLSAIQKAAYQYSGKFDCRIEQANEEFKVYLLAKVKDINLQKEIANFCTEVLDQQLREKIGKETEAIRNLILAQAFSKTSLIDNNNSD